MAFNKWHPNLNPWPLVGYPPLVGNHSKNFRIFRDGMLRRPLWLTEFSHPTPNKEDFAMKANRSAWTKEWENGKEYPENGKEEVQVGRRAGQCKRPSQAALRKHSEEWRGWGPRTCLWPWEILWDITRARTSLVVQWLKLRAPNTRFDPWSGNRSYMPQLKILNATTEKRKEGRKKPFL